MAEIEIINIKWEGPLKPEEAYEKNGRIDYGVYQYYGDHPVYGLNVLLEIGADQEKTFGERLKEYEFEKWNEDIQIYLGRICIEKESVQPTAGQWNSMITRAGKLLNYACYPAFNGFDSINKRPRYDDKNKKLLILNWGKYRSLPATVSGYRVVEESLGDSFQFMGQ